VYNSTHWFFLQHLNFSPISISFMDLLQTFVQYSHVPVCQEAQGKCGMSSKSELAVFQLNFSPS
jgi:hypothetical protein